MNKNKLRALRGLSTSRSYVLVTEKEGFMAVDFGRVEDMNSTIEIAQQRSTLDAFRRELDKTIRKFDTKLAKSTPRKKGKKIPVQAG